MRLKVSLPIPTASHHSGFSLVELIVTMFLTGIMLGVMTSFAHTGVQARDQGSLENEVNQGLRALISTLTQELRQAGACLPRTSGMIALAGVDNGFQDKLTLRMGKVDRTMLRCVLTSVQVAAAIGETSVTLQTAAGFQAGDLVYVTPDGAAGNFYGIASIAGDVVTLNSGLVKALPPGAGMYAVEERAYEIQLVHGRPMLMESVNRGTAYPVIAGVEELDVRYYLGPCDLDNSTGLLVCADSVPLPATPWEWSIVNALGIKAKVSAHKVDKRGYTVSTSTGASGQPGEYVIVKPRNLLS